VLKLFEFIKNGEIKGRHREIAEYASAHPDEFKKFLETLFSDSRSNVRESKIAVLDLVDYLSANLSQSIVEYGIKDSEAEVRVYAVKAAYRTRIETLNEDIISILSDKDEIFEVKKWIIHILASSDPHAYARILRKIARDVTESKDLRKEAIFALTNLDDEMTIGALCTLLGDNDNEIRQSGAWALSKMGVESSINCLLAATEDDDETVRDWSIRALRDMDDTRALQGLADILKIAEPSEQIRLIRLLVERRSEIILRAIAERLSSPDVRVRREAAWAMGVTLFTPAIPNLQNLVNDDDEQVKEYAKTALMRMGEVDPTDFGLNL
jgi:HEAT repeat protein